MQLGRIEPTLLRRCSCGSQIRHHGFEPTSDLIYVKPRDGLLALEDICGMIDAHADRLALVMLGGVNYLTGQVLPMEAIAAHVHGVNQKRAAKGACESSNHRCFGHA